jgi:acyl carrier protein
MSDHHDDVVRRAIARHGGVDPSAIDSSQHLQRDLHLHPLDIVLIVLAIEDAERIVIPIGHLEAVNTVSGLATVVRRASASAPHAHRPAFVPILRRYRRSRRFFVRRLQEA